METPTEVKVCANKLAEKLNADIIFWNGPVERYADSLLIAKCIHRDRRENVLLLMVTSGGDADAAYRVARCLQDKYNHFHMYISGRCKSAGTLIALGAHELIMSDHGELGPIDAQMQKKDEIWGTQSGLTVMDALSSLETKAFSSFEKMFLDIQIKGGASITLKTAAQIATEMTAGLFAPLYAQIDPMHIGEAWRAMNIADRYGKNLLSASDNATEQSLDILTTDYPSHGFVIDRKEAEELFKSVRPPNEEEKNLAEALGKPARIPKEHPLRNSEILDFISDLPAKGEPQES